MTPEESGAVGPWGGYSTSLIEVDWCGRTLVVTPDGDRATVVAPAIGPLAVVSACNPASSRRVAGENQRATRALKRRLVDLGVPHTMAVGYSARRDWVEPSFALVDVEPEVTHALCREFRQIAYFWIDQGRICVVDEAGVTRSSRGAAIRTVRSDASVLAGLRSWFDT